MKNSSAGSGTAIYNKTKKLITLLAVSLLTMLSVDAVFANPTGGQVTAGSATISQSPGDTQINQTSDKAIIN